MSGDEEVVSAQKPAFIQFLKSLSFEEAPAGALASGLPPSHPPVGGDASAAPNVSPPATATGGTRPSWQVPSNWQEANAGQFLVAKYMVGGAGGSQTVVNVSASAGAGGGVLMNVNRWRGQLGLGEVSEAEVNKLLTPLEAAGPKAVVVDMTGKDGRTGQNARLVAAIVPQQDQTWFYKLMGNDQVVEREKDAFSKFVQSAKYH
jgi:hypothetical protein